MMKNGEKIPLLCCCHWKGTWNRSFISTVSPKKYKSIPSLDFPST